MAREVVKIEGLRGVLEQLQALPPAIVSKSGGPVKLALKKAADVLRDEVIANTVNLILQPNDSGIPYDGQYTLAKNIVTARSKTAPGVNGERMIVKVRRKPYDVGSGAKPVSTPQVARLLEYGTEKRQPMPIIRPAFDAKKSEAIQVFVAEMRKRTDAAIKKAERLARMQK